MILWLNMARLASERQKVNIRLYSNWLLGPPVGNKQNESEKHTMLN